MYICFQHLPKQMYYNTISSYRASVLHAGYYDCLKMFSLILLGFKTYRLCIDSSGSLLTVKMNLCGKGPHHQSQDFLRLQPWWSLISSSA